MSRQTVFRLAIVILAVSATAGAVLGKGPFPGLDFQNIDAFHDCLARDNPYLSSGAACGDYLGRDMYYPPLLYWSFAWTRLLPFEAGYVLWVIVSVISTSAVLAMWVPAARRDGPMLLFGGLLMLQFPMLFALERGNNDVIVLVLWSLSAWLLLKDRLGWAGFAAGISVLLKLYPAIAVMVVLAGLLSWARGSRVLGRPIILYCAGGLMAVVIAGLPFIGQAFDYAQTQLPVLMAYVAESNLATHELSFIAPGGMSWTLSLPLLAVWAWASHRQLTRDPVLVLSGALAISTYFSSVSVDYNLITTYPFLIVLFTRATASNSSVATAAVLLFGLVAIIGHRAAFLLLDGDFGVMVHIWLQWIWLMAAGIAVGRSHISIAVDQAGSARTPSLPGPPTVADGDAA